MKHFTMLCVAIAAEYAPVATLLTGTCGTLEPTSAVFLLTMLHHYAEHITAIHWSGSREQLHADKFKDFIKDWNGWNVPHNPWRFLFKSQSSFALSVAVQRAKASPNASTRLYDASTRTTQFCSTPAPRSPALSTRHGCALPMNRARESQK